VREGGEAGSESVSREVGLPLATPQVWGDIKVSRSRGKPELVASFVNRSNLLKLWENTDPCAVSTAGVHGPKNTAITRIPAHALPRAVYPVAADKYFGPLPSPLRGVNQRVINARIGFSEPRTALLASSWTHLARVIPGLGRFSGRWSPIGV